MDTLTSRIRAAWALIDGWRYSTGAPEVPELLPGMPRRLRVRGPGQGPGATNCSTWTSYAILKAYPEAITLHPDLYADLQVQDRERPWSPIAAVIAAGIGERVALDGVPVTRWALAQSWSRLSPEGHVVAGRSRGHARIVRREAGGMLRVLESSASAGRSVESVVPVAQVARWGDETRWALLDELGTP